MSFPATIHTAVGPSLIGKVSRLFNNSATDVLSELLQNARRAGASRVAIDVASDDGRSLLVIRDNGSGIDDPAKLVTLGESGWNGTIAHREDPAGMGVFSLAGRHVEIRSRAKAAGRSWRVIIPPDAWENGTPLNIEPSEIDAGTEIRIDMPEAWTKEIAGAAANAAQYYPLPVRFDGTDLKRGDFLKDALRIEHWQGCRIGVFHDRGHYPSAYPRINFHGLTVLCPMPSVSEVEGEGQWHVRVDIIDAPALQLVLPARKEMVQNAALGHLREAAERAIFRTIAHAGSHRLSYPQWSRARELGITLPEAQPWLSAWLPRTADGNGHAEGERTAGVPMILFPQSEPPIEQCAARVLKDGEPLGGALVREVPAFEGYAWYDALPCIASLVFRIEGEAGTFTHEEGQSLPDGLESGRVASIMLEIAVSSSRPSAEDTKPYALPVDVLVVPDDGWSADLDQTVILLSPDSGIDPAALTDLLENACFCAGDDVENDSWQTQQSNFLMEARQIATTLLLGEDAAIIERIRAVIRDEAGWLIPEGRRISMVAGRDRIDLAFIEDPLPRTD